MIDSMEEALLALGIVMLVLTALLGLVLWDWARKRDTPANVRNLERYRPDPFDKYRDQGAHR